MSTINGIGSGLDIHALVKAQVEATSAPKQSQIMRQKIKLETNISTLSAFTAAIKNYQETLAKLSTKGFKPCIADVNDNKVANVTITNRSTYANFKLEVLELAQGAKITSKLLVNNYQTTTAGNLQINLGEHTYSVAINNGDTLEQIAQNINNQLASQKISANIIHDQNGQRLVLSSNASGNKMQLSVNSNIAELQIDGSKKQTDNNAGVLEFARDATFKLDGMKLSNSSNKLDKLISGLNINLTAIGTTNLAIKENNAQITQDLDKFIKSYNQVINLSNTFTTNDFSLKRLVNNISHNLSPYMADLGLTTERDGTISKNSKQHINPQQIALTFTKDAGVLAQMTKLCSEVIDKNNLLTTKQHNFTNELKKLDLEQENLNKQAKSLSETLYRKFNAMDEIVGKLTSIRQNLAAMFDAMNDKNKQ